MASFGREVVRKFKVKRGVHCIGILLGHIHWLSSVAPNILPAQAEIRLYDYLFTVDGPDEDWETQLNPRSEIIVNAFIDPSLVAAASNIAGPRHFQFERIGYFALDKDTDVDAGKFVFNRTLPLRISAGKAAATSGMGKEH